MTTDLHLDTGAMALDSLPADERAEFNEHLSTCPTCPAELVGFLETAALLGAAVAQPAPAGLRARVLAAIKDTAQLPPVLPVQDDTTALGRHRVTGSDETAPTESSAQVIPLRRPWYRRPQAYLAAAAAAVVIAGGTTAIVVNSGGNAQPQASCASTASDRTTESQNEGPSGVVIYSASCRQATVIAAGLPALPTGKVYQLWALNKVSTVAPRSLGVMKAAANGAPDTTSAMVNADESTVAISEETAPGPAATPTKVVWAAQL